MEFDVNRWLQCFTRAESDDNDKESKIMGNDQEINDLTGNPNIKADNFGLYRYTKKTSPSLIDAEMYYDYYNTQVIRFDVSFLSSVENENTDTEKLYYTSLNSIDDEYGTGAIKDSLTANANNNFFVGATIEDFGSYKTLSLTLKDRTFTTLSQYIYQAISLGNGNTKAFGTETTANQEQETDESNLINTELTETTTLKFLKTPTVSKIKNNLKIRFGYQTTTSNGKTNVENVGGIFGAASHRWTTATQWEGSTNINGVEVTPNKVLAVNKHQTTKVLPEMDFFITDLSTNLTPTGITYNIKASSTENFVLNNIKFLQQYSVLRGKPKSLLASLMRVFNSSEETPVKLVWCDEEYNTRYLNGSEILKNYKNGKFEVMDEDTVKNTIEDDRKTLNDINKQIEVLSNLRDIFSENTNASFKVNDNDLGFSYLKNNVINSIKSASGMNETQIKKHNFENVVFYPLRSSIGRGGSEDTGQKINSIQDSKNIVYLLDVCKNNKYFGSQQDVGTDKKLNISYNNVLGTWINFVKSKVSVVNDEDGERKRQEKEYEGYLAIERKKEAKERLSNAALKLEKTWNYLNSNIPIISSNMVNTTSAINYENTTLGGLLISLPVKDNIHICEKTSNGAYLDGSYFSSYGIFRDVLPETLYDTYKTKISEKDMTSVKDFSDAYDEIYNDDSNIWNKLKDSSLESKVILGAESTIYNSLNTNSSLLELLDSFDSSNKYAEKYLEMYKKYKMGTYSFNDSLKVKNNNENVDINLTTSTVGLFNNGGGILSPFAAEAGLVENIYSSPSAYGLPNSYGNYKIIKQGGGVVTATEFINTVESYIEKIEKACSILSNAGIKGQPLIISASGDNSKIEELRVNIKIENEDGSTSDRSVNIFNDGKNDLNDSIKGKLTGVGISDGDISCLKEIFVDLLNKLIKVGDYNNAPLRSLVLLTKQIYLALKKYTSSGYPTINNIKSAKQDLAKTVFKYISSDNDFKDALTRYYIAAIDYYFKSKDELDHGAATTTEYSWEVLSKKVIASVIEANGISASIKSGRIKKQGEGDSLTFSDMEFGSSTDGTKNYFDEAYKFTEITSSEGVGDQINSFVEELNKQIKDFEEIKDIINKEYAKASETKIGKEIVLSLGSEDSQNKSDRYVKSLSSLFNDFCAQCMPMTKATDIIATSARDEEGNSTTSTITDEATKQSLTWSVVGKYNGQPIIGFYYKEPKIPSYIREYCWGTGNSKMHCIKDINISTASEYAMYSSVNTMSLNKGKLESAGVIDYVSDRRTQVGQILKSSDTTSTTEIDAFFPSIVSNGSKQKNLMNNLLQAVNKGTVTLLGDPSLVFSGEIQPYTYPIFLNIKLQQEGASWSKSPSGEYGGVSLNVQSYLSGIYVVGKITHSFSTSGYTTTLEVTRYPGLDRQYKSAINFN